MDTDPFIKQSGEQLRSEIPAGTWMHDALSAAEPVIDAVYGLDKSVDCIHPSGPPTEISKIATSTFDTEFGVGIAMTDQDGSVTDIYKQVMFGQRGDRQIVFRAFSRGMDEAPNTLHAASRDKIEFAAITLGALMQSVQRGDVQLPRQRRWSPRMSRALGRVAQ